MSVVDSIFECSVETECVAAALLVPVRAAMRGSFPLAGTYFQVPQASADHWSCVDSHVRASMSLFGAC